MEKTTNNGISFCQVVNKIHVFHLQVVITLGNQKWHGKDPSFINNAINIKYLNKTFENIKNHIDILHINIHEEAIDWTIKYFTAPSISIICLLLSIKGMNLNIFNSIDIQIKNQFLLEIAINTLKINVILIIILIGGIYIRNW